MKKLLYILLFVPFGLLAQTGTQFIEQESPLEFSEGWSMFGFSCFESINVAEALISIEEKVLIVKNDSGSVYMPEFFFNGIGDFRFNKGYQIKLTETISGFQFCPAIVPLVAGCMDEGAFNYNSSANIDDGSCIPFIFGCLDSSYIEYNELANTDNGSCETEIILGCTNPYSQGELYNPLANADDGSCILIGCADSMYLEYYTQGFTPSINEETYNDLFCSEIAVFGCTDSSYFEYNSEANIDDGSCLLVAEYGCMDLSAFNYSSGANIDDGSCYPIISGCLDSLACNFNNEANVIVDCEYPEIGYNCDGFTLITQLNIGEAVDSWLEDSISTELQYGHIMNWDVSTVTDMFHLFYFAENFNSDLSSWDVSNVTDMSGMFAGAENFNKDLSSWDVSNVTDMSGMFYEAESFNGDLSSWDLSNVLSMLNMFKGVTNFTGDLSSWEVSNVANMSGMFYEAESFNSDLSSWDVSSVTDMSNMFNGAENFNGDLSSWDVSNVANMVAMFYEVENFNSDLSSWDVSNVNSMRSMFFGAALFTSDLSNWDVSNVIDMMSVFRGATNFTSDLSSWDVSSVAIMSSMFYEAENFNSDLSSWDVSSVTTIMSNMFFGAGLSEENQCAIQASFSSNENWPYNWVCNYEIGDFAKGGVIFYLDETGQHGLVAALEDLEETHIWGCYIENIYGASGDEIGSGYQNTLDIVAGCSETPIAASEALAYESEGYGDWYLPSRLELLEIYNSIGNTGSVDYIGGFESDYYLSSTENGLHHAWAVYFGSGDNALIQKNTSKVVRVIRSF